MAVPIVTIGIFFYQAYAEQYFVLVVVAMEIWAVGQAFKGFMTDRQNKMVLVSSGSLGLATLTSETNQIFDTTSDLIVGTTTVALTDVTAALQVTSTDVTGPYNSVYSLQIGQNISINYRCKNLMPCYYLFLDSLWRFR